MSYSGGKGVAERGSIAVTFTIIVIAIFLVTQGFLWVMLLMSQRDINSQRLAEKADEIASLVASVSSTSIPEGRMSDLNDYIEKVASSEDVIKVSVLDPGGKVLAHAQGITEPDGFNLKPFYINWSEEIRKPVLMDDQSAAEVVLTISGRSVNDDMRYLLWQMLIFMTVITLFLPVPIFIFTNRYLGKPIELLKDTMVRVTRGDLTVRIPDVGSKEIGDIAEGLQYLIKGLSSNVLSLKNAARSISSAIVALKSTFKTTADRVKTQSLSTNQIAGTMKLADESQGKIKDNTTRLSGLLNENLSSVLEMKSREEEILGSIKSMFSSIDNSYSVVAEMSQTAKGMMENASRVLGSVENTSASVEEIIASVKEVEGSARESSKLADNVRELAAHRGIVTVEKAISGMGMISDKVSRAVDIVRKLDRRSNDVQKILVFIKDVTEKTNLLSINASILAEQAGEYGKGFTVVADQMRSLSTATGGYTGEISDIVKKIQSEVGEAVNAIEQGNDMVKDGSDIVYEVGETMSSILESSHKSANMTKMIERATEDQVIALRHIENSVIEINRMALESDKAMGEMHKSSGYLFDNFGEVRDVAEMTMKGSGEIYNAVKFISENLERSADGIAGIEDAISVQRHQGKDILGGVESIRNEGVWIINDLEGLSDSIEKLKHEFDGLKDGMDSLRVD